MNRLRLNIWGSILIVIFSNSVSAIEAPVGQNATPLLMANKQTLFQRVLTLPGAQLFPQAQVTEDTAIPLPPFSVYYVYQRVNDKNQQQWLEIGLNQFGTKTGWVNAAKTMDWSIGLTLKFRDPTPQNRVLLFNNKDSIATLAQQYDTAKYDQLYQAAVQEKSLTNWPIVAIQPATPIDMTQNFYLLPIHDFEEIYFKDTTARLLQVSSVPVDGGKATLNTKKKPAFAKGKAAYSADVVFVIDTTLSMQPYIDRTHEAVRKIYSNLEQASLSEYVSFGLVGFRDNPEAAEGINYLTQRFVSLQEGRIATRFMKGVVGMKAADFSTQDFKEDSFAGITDALSNMDWTPNAARYVVLITDAGSRESGDPLAKSGHNAETLNKLAQENNSAVFVLHLLTPDPDSDHDSATEQYLRLSDYPGIGSLYYGVGTGNIKEFGDVLDSLANQITSQIAQHEDTSKSVSNIDTQQNPQLIELQNKVAKLGRALKLRYLQDTEGGQAPDVFKSWILDKQFHNPEKSAIDVCVLLSRDQLSDLHNILRQVLETAEQGLLSPGSFIKELQGLAATLTRDPKRLGSASSTAKGNKSLADIGFMREYIEDLPYTGQVMRLALQDWQSWTAGEQVKFLHQLEEKIAYYRALHDQVDSWISLDGGPIDGGSVYPIPLDKLP